MNARLPQWLRVLLDTLALWLMRQDRPAVLVEPFPEIRASHIASDYNRQRFGAA